MWEESRRTRERERGQGKGKGKGHSCLCDKIAAFVCVCVFPFSPIAPSRSHTHTLTQRRDSAPKAIVSRRKKLTTAGGKALNSLTHTHTHSLSFLLSPSMRSRSSRCPLALAHTKLCKMVALQGALLYGRLACPSGQGNECEREGLSGQWVVGGGREKKRRCDAVNEFAYFCCFTLIAYFIHYVLALRRMKKQGERRRKVS